ncbi:hypothetical protein TNIN_497852 [Trichonephila inaurata madagascariensis]|uniref:RRM domain-containing protein n=1 Tax=Trichonephila inaurata madagascariensis TaxID=2747483 RepID=A0A8X6WSP5_9ARAC|nr:hypothetical protein TNIN_497852 [Trichonephila inaurata madagascariensis]
MVPNHRVLTRSNCTCFWLCFAEIENWNPMVDDFYSSKFSSYHDNMNQQYDPCSLYVKNIPADLSEETFFSLMSERNKKIKRFRILPVKPNSPFTCALVSV